MPSILGDRLVRVWFMLVLATGVACRLGGESFGGVALGSMTIALAWFKARLVVLDFMELRHAPTLWRGIVEGWLVVVSMGVLVVYWMSAPG